MTTMTVTPRAPAPAEAKLRPPDRLALQITGRPYVSHSQLSLMRTCPRRFSFQYKENAPKDFVPVSLLYGGAIHAAVEAFYRARLEGVTIAAEAMLDAYHTAWGQNLKQSGEELPVKYGAKEDEAGIHALARRTIDAFLASPLAHPKGHVLGVEEELRLRLDPDLPVVLTKVDLVTASDTALYVTDFKTSRSKWTPEKAQEASDQLVLYAGATQGMASSIGLPIRLAFAVLTKAKAPQVQVLPVEVDPARAAADRTKRTPWKPTVIRYADDFVIFHRDRKALEQAKELAAAWLKDMGLEMKPSKTRITHTLEGIDGPAGFDFLGFNIRQYPRGKNRCTHTGRRSVATGFAPSIRPSAESQKRFLTKIRQLIREKRNAEQAGVIRLLNPVIRGWGNYYSSVVSKDIFGKMDMHIFQKLWAWALRRHPNKGLKWVAHKYWLLDSNRGWTFGIDGKITLHKLGEIPIERHVKVQGERSPFDGDAIYWSSRAGAYPNRSLR